MDGRAVLPAGGTAVEPGVDADEVGRDGHPECGGSETLLFVSTLSCGYVVIVTRTVGSVTLTLCCGFVVMMTRTVGHYDVNMVVWFCRRVHACCRLGGVAGRRRGWRSRNTFCYVRCVPATTLELVVCTHSGHY